VTALADLPALQRPGVREALVEVLLAVADDELVIGHRHSEWTGLGPDIESDVALSSLAQEELGHARLFYEQVADLTGGDPDTLAFGRPADQFRNTVLVERPNGDWADTLVRLVLYEYAEQVRLDALAASSLSPLAELAAAVRREERYHRMYGEQWLRRLAAATADSRARVQAAVERLWPQTADLFDPPAGVEAAAGLLAVDPDTLRSRWRQAVVPFLEGLGLVVGSDPVRVGPGGRSGRHTPDLQRLLDEMTSVWRLEPGSRW
jgi:ring-1,2-phenylacetyl-CoA epoxidase subunit PaaC